MLISEMTEPVARTGAEPEALRTCTKCCKDMPPSAFNLNRRGPGGRDYECRRCRNRRRRLTIAIAAWPDGVAASNVIIDGAPDPAPARWVRDELARQRRVQDREFRIAWPIALSVALRGLPALEAASWRRALSETRRAWQAAYEGEGAPIRLFVAEGQDEEDEQGLEELMTAA